MTSRNAPSMPEGALPPVAPVVGAALSLVVKDLGLIGYPQALEVQERLVGRICEGSAETLLLLEHAPVYTIGSGGKLANLLDPAIAALRVNRGGDVTYHGPGQLVGYPLIDLSRRGKDLHRYLRFLEEFLVEIASALSVPSFPVSGRTGVWTERGKLASIGVGVRRWVTMHGFALNLDLDVTPFRRINPCGMADCPVTSLAMERGATLAMAELKQLVASRFASRLDERLPRKR